MSKIHSQIMAAVLLLVAFPAFPASTVWLKDQHGNVCRNSLSNNPGQVIGYGGHDGVGNFTLTISNPTDGVLTPSAGRCLLIPKTGTSLAAIPIVFSGPAKLFQNVSINMLKPGTSGALECLSQGRNVVGINATNPVLTSAPYTLRLTFSRTDGCNPLTGSAITPDGQPTFIRGARIEGGAQIFFGTYYIFDSAAIPEPGTLLLFLLGAISVFLARSAREACMQSK